MLALGLLLNFAGIGLFCWLIFTLAASIAATLLFGTVPAIRASKTDLVSSLKNGGRGGTDGRRRR